MPLVTQPLYWHFKIFKIGVFGLYCSVVRVLLPGIILYFDFDAFETFKALTANVLVSFIFKKFV